MPRRPIWAAKAVARAACAAALALALAANAAAVDEGTLVDEAAAVEVLAMTEALAAGEPVAVVVDLTRIAFANHESRDMFAVNPSGGIEVATALVATARVAEFLAGRFMNTAQLSRPAQLFESTDDAARWAAEQVAVFHHIDARFIDLGEIKHGILVAQILPP